MDINFEYYKVFYFVAKCGNITRAAAALKSNQPNVTRMMKILEAQLGCKLLTREARGVSLTQEGELLFSHVEIAYRHLLNAQEEIGRQGAEKGGTVEIGATETALHLFLLQALHDFKKEYPAIRIKIHNQTTPETMKQFDRGHFDLAVITTPFEAPKTVSCITALEFTEILAGGTQYQDVSRTGIEIEDVKQYPWIGLGRESAGYRLYKDFFIAHGIDLEPEMEVATSDLMLPLLANNLGIGFVPEKLAEPLLKEGRLVRIPLGAEVPRRAIQIISEKGRGNSPAASIFYQFLLQRAN